MTPQTLLYKVTYINFAFYAIIMSLCAAPSPPYDVSVLQNGLNSASVSWLLEPAGSGSGITEPAVTGYIISYQTLDGGHSDSVNVDGTATSTIITGLMTGATYSITIVATSSTLPSTETIEDITIGTGLYCVVFILMSPQSQPPSP